MIIGVGGSGKSVLARRLGEVTKLPVYHLDALYWKPGWIPTPYDEWVEVQRELVKRDEWIIDGMYSRTLDIRMSEADTIIFFDIARWIPIYRVIKRRIQYHGKTRPDLSEGCPEKLDWQFIKWIWNFGGNRRASIMDKLNTFADKNIIILRTVKEANHLIIKAEMGK